MLKNTFKLFALVGLTIAAFSCDDSTKETTTPIEKDTTELIVADSSPVILEGITVIVHEHHFNNIPVTSHGKNLIEKTTPTNLPADGTKEQTTTEVKGTPSELSTNDSNAQTALNYDVHTLKQINAALLMAEYEAAMEEVTVEEAIIPLEETQTIVAYNKKNEEEATLQIISVPGSEEIQQIIFTDKKHKDVYNVQAGMSGKEAKQLRKELKHMEYKGDHYLYDDQSNIMYLMNAKNGYGDEITEVDIEQMEISAIIWKDKKHHKKEKEEAK